MDMTMRECCCSDMGVAWSAKGEKVCLHCPERTTREFEFMCPNGIGFVEHLDGSVQDINECELPGICENGKCINTDGSYRCECSNGFRINYAGDRCTDIDECSEQEIDCGNGTCVNEPGKFQCRCFIGFAQGASQRCEDINECDGYLNQCAFRCKNIPGSYRCTCPRGYRLSANGRHCEDINECTESLHNCLHTCKNLVGSFACTCPEGFRPKAGTADCEDIDECSETNYLCEHGQCVNTRGSYQCNCDSGFDQGPAGKTCVSTSLEYCFMSSSCVKRFENLAQTTRSQCCCGLGVAWGLDTCDECPAPNTQTWHQMCPKGIGYDGFGNDTDECAVMPSLCANGMCINQKGSFQCMCNDGYKIAIDGNRCEDLDECERGTHQCDQLCMNMIGTYMCACNKGFVLDVDGKTCIDVDECKAGRHQCEHQCVNVAGGYKCSCGPNYRMTAQGSCEDKFRTSPVNECRENPYRCGEGGGCRNLIGSFECVCDAGFIPGADRKSCEDLDECAIDQYACFRRGFCHNTLGSFRCLPYPPPVLTTTRSPGSGGSPGGQPGSKSNTTGGPLIGVTGTITWDPRRPPSTFGPFGPGGPGGQIRPGGGSDGVCTGCVFGCTAAMLCTCPSGYQVVGEGHCVSSQDPWAGFPSSGAQHVPNPGNNDHIPAGEGCYDCPDSPAGSENAATGSNGRRKRSVASKTDRFEQLIDDWRRDLRNDRKLLIDDRVIQPPPTAPSPPLPHRAVPRRTIHVPFVRAKQGIVLLKIGPAKSELSNSHYEIRSHNKAVEEYLELVHETGGNFTALVLRRDLQESGTLHLTIGCRAETPKVHPHLRLRVSVVFT